MEYSFPQLAPVLAVCALWILWLKRMSKYSAEGHHVLQWQTKNVVIWYSWFIPSTSWSLCDQRDTCSFSWPRSPEGFGYMKRTHICLRLSSACFPAGECMLLLPSGHMGCSNWTSMKSSWSSSHLSHKDNIVFCCSRGCWVGAFVDCRKKRKTCLLKYEHNHNVVLEFFIF